MKGKRGGVDLASFISGMVRGVTTGQQALVTQRRHHLEKHFKQDDGVYTPITLQFDTGDDRVLNVPQYVLSRTHQLGLDAALIRGAVRIVGAEEIPIECPMTGHDHTTVYSVKEAHTGQKGAIEIELRFSKRQDCEAEERLTEALLAQIETQIKNE